MRKRSTSTSFFSLLCFLMSRVYMSICSLRALSLFCPSVDQDLIVQHIVVDGLLLAVCIFQVERTASGRAPAAELIDFEKRRATPMTGTSRPPSQSFPSPPMIAPLQSTAVPSPGYMAANAGYGFSPLSQLSGLSPPTAVTGDMVGPGIVGSTGGQVALDNGGGLLGTSSSPGRMYYPQS